VPPLEATPSTRSGNDASSVVRGSTLPRLWTPPLITEGDPGGCPCGCALTPLTSFGFDLIDFARDAVGTPFDPWQEFLAIHVGELLPDGRPRFRYVLVLVARQNGKTTFGDVLILYWLFIDRVDLVLGTSTDRSYAKRAWERISETAIANRWLRKDLSARPIKKEIGGESFKTKYGAEYIFAANNGRAGRSTTLHRWLADEVREHKNHNAYDSASKAMNAVPDAQLVGISNQGDSGAVVLDRLRKPAVEFIETGQGDRRMGLFEWSAPDGAEPDDLEALAMANPNMGRRLDGEVLQADGRRAKAAGGEELAGFRTEVLCQRVLMMDPAIDSHRWEACFALHPVDLANHRQRVCLCLDVALDGSHATLVAAAKLTDGYVHTEVVRAWDGFGCTKRIREELPDLVAKVRPRLFGWFPNGPAAAVAADLAAPKAKRRGASWPPRGVTVEAITSETAAVCMGLAEIVKAEQVRHPGDPVQTAHIGAAQKLRQGDRWVFVRQGADPIDGAYATGGAVHLARLLPDSRKPLAAV
jgi:hypothetical protein